MTIFGNTIQLYTTPNCDMGCKHCRSKLLTMKNMELSVFSTVLDCIKQLGIERVELFANNPILHPQIKDQIRLLNESGLTYAILVVGDTPNHSTIESFKELCLLIDKERGGLVFSVDFTKERSEIIMANRNLDLFPYAFKALTFWKLIPFLQANKIKVRTNTVISIYNINEVQPIIQSVLEMGFSASCCFVQTCEFEFRHIFKYKNEPMNPFQLNYMNYFMNIFNCFRDLEDSESAISILDTVLLRGQLLTLKERYPQLFLPNEDFIRNLGTKPKGCMNLIEQSRFPQLKIGCKGEMIYCCDLHDPITESYHIWDFPRKIDEFVNAINTNPYIMLCNLLNPCDFSINYVKYQTNRGGSNVK